MIPFDEIDSRLEKLGKDRAWLAENTPYSADYIRTVMAPNSTRRTDRIQSVLSDAIDREEATQAEAARKKTEEEPRLSFLALHITTAELNEWALAYKVSQAETLEEWVLQCIRTAFLAETGTDPANILPIAPAAIQSLRPRSGAE